MFAVGSGCVSTDTTEPPPGFYRSSVRGTTRYLQWAVEERSPRHVWNCISDGWKNRDANLSLSNLELFFEEIEAELTRSVGDIRKVKITSDIKLNEVTREVTYESGERRAVVIFVRETTFELKPNNPGRDSVHGSVTAMEEILNYKDGNAIVTLPNVPSKYRADELELVKVESTWRIDQIIEQNLKTTGESGGSITP